MATALSTARLTQAQIEMYARSAGLSPDRARIAGAVAMAESGGKPSAHNALPPDNSYGLWQINMLGSMGPERRAKLGISANEELYDPAVNARAMALISGGGSNFGPWSTYTSGAYKKYLATSGGAVPAGWDPFEKWWNDLLGEPKRGPGSPDWNTDPFGLGSLGGDGIGGGLGVGDIAGGVKSIAELMVGAAGWMSDPHNWVRAAQVVGGLLLVGVGVAAMTRGVWAPAAAAVSKVTPVAKAATAVEAAAKTPAKAKAKAS